MHFYFIKNNTYLSELRQTLSMNHLDEIVDNSLSIYNLYAYNIGVNNPVEVTYNDHTMYSGHDLTYEEIKERELKKVKQVFRNKTKEWLYLKVLNEETQKEEQITCTKNHRIYIKNKGWIEAKDILENDIILMYNNIQGRVINKELQILVHFETTYNFEVEDNHNYYVSEECILVHNDCDGIDQNQINVGNAKNNRFAKSYDEAKDIAKEISVVSVEPFDIVPNKYGGYDYIYYRPSKKGTVEVIIKDHVTGHPNRGMSKHINVHNGIDNKKWHVFY